MCVWGIRAHVVRYFARRDVRRTSFDRGELGSSPRYAICLGR